MVPDVSKFPGHIACSSKSQSEIVIPVRGKDKNEFIGLLDVDSAALADFDETDRIYLFKVIHQLEKLDQFSHWEWH